MLSLFAASLKGIELVLAICRTPRDRHEGSITFWQDALKNKHLSTRKAPVLVDALCGDPGGKMKANR
jgi:hypothetical protein